MKKSKLPKTVRTIAAIANLIRAEFKTPCDKRKVDWWRHHTIPPFPSPGENNAYNVKECFDWVKKNIKQAQPKPAKASQLELLHRRGDEAHAQRKITAAEREIWEFEHERDLHITKDMAFQKLCAVVSKLKLFILEAIEKRAVAERREKLRSLGISEDLVTQFFVWDNETEKKLMNGIALRCQQESVEDETVNI